MKEKILRVTNPLPKKENLLLLIHQKIKRNLHQANRETILLEKNHKIYLKESLTKKNKRMIQLIKQIINRMIWMLNNKVVLNQKKEIVKVVKTLKILSLKVIQNLNQGYLKKLMLKKHLILNQNQREEKLQLPKRKIVRPLTLREEAQENQQIMMKNQLLNQERNLLPVKQWKQRK